MAALSSRGAAGALCAGGVLCLFGVVDLGVLLQVERLDLERRDLDVVGNHCMCRSQRTLTAPPASSQLAVLLFWSVSVVTSTSPLPFDETVPRE